MLPRLIVCVVLLSVAMALPASAEMVMIDDFTDNTLDSNWVQSNVLTGGAGGTYTFDTTTHDNELTVTNSGWSTGGATQDVLLRSDYSLNVGDTLLTDIAHLPSVSDNAGLLIAAATGITSPANLIYIGWRGDLDGVLAYYHDSSGAIENWGGVWPVSPAAVGLFIERTSLNTYEVGYDTGTGPVSLKTFTVTGVGNLNPGAAVGYRVDIRGDNEASSFDNLRIDVIPEPSTLALLATGLIGLCYAWRKRKCVPR